MHTATASAWLTFFGTTAGAKLRLFCFPYAGAGASIYRTWAENLPADIEVCGVQYPGREARIGENTFTGIVPLVDALVPVMLKMHDRPFAFFGHSMGALVAFELTRELYARHDIKPEHVFFSGAGAPHVPEPRLIHCLDDVSFLRELIKLNGMPPEVLRSPELLAYALPVLRADFKACESYRYQVGPPLPCPVTAFGGAQDPRVDRQRIEAWSNHASVYFSSTMLPGDHFFLRTGQSRVLRELVNELRPLMASLI